MLMFAAPVEMNANALDTLKGVWTGIESFAQKFTGIFKMMGSSFGASPSGYVYSCDVYNDMSNQNVYVAISEIMSFMGGDLPKANGWSATMIAPGMFHAIKDQDYYFEMFIKLTDKKYSSCMPYLPHEDMLLRHDATALEGQQNSANVHYFRAFMGKDLINGQYVHTPKAESLGYINKNPADVKTDPGSATIGSTLTSLTIYNSSSTDYYVGFSINPVATITKDTCWSYALVPANSFAILNVAAPVMSLTPGMIGIFDATSQQLIKSYKMPTTIFQTLPHHAPMPYTLEIYQDKDASSGVLQSVNIEMQGLMSGNYDQPIGKVCDITPVTCVFWYESLAQLGTAGYVDLTPGKVWIVQVQKNDKGQDVKIITGATPGQALQFNLTRPQSGQKLWIYFVYADTASDSLAQQYILNFFTKPIGQAMVQAYHQQGEDQIKLAQSPLVVSASIPQTLLIQAAQAALTLQGGSVKDDVTGVTGYLLGADLFLSSGVGAGPMYYQLQPSQTNSQNIILPTSTVQNLYISTAGSVAPAGLPAVTIVK